LTALILFTIVLVLGSYLIGSLPFGLWIGLAWKHVDIREQGSKNIGATNAFRVLGSGPASVVFVLDAGKGIAAILLGHYLESVGIIHGLTMPLFILIGISAVLGHSFSPFLGFKGGKGVSTSLGMLLALSWLVAAIALLSWLIMLAITRYVSVASVVAAFVLPFAADLCLQGDERVWMIGLGVTLALLVAVKHYGNLQRLLAGTEPRIGQQMPPVEETH